NPQNREMMRDLYKLLEKYEEPLNEDGYWVKLEAECNELYMKYNRDKLAFALLAGLMDGLSAKLKAGASEQIRMVGV
ncbi:MAG: hypothetical protein PHY12_05755, partial [Eubacteriales bacterium]|nr:hypothetical protein [Eubacteriales bacterium]